MPPRSPSPVKPRPRIRGAELEGVISVHPRGFGFVSLQDGAGDVFVPPDDLGGALHNDRVVVRLQGQGARGHEGTVVKVLARGLLRLAGTLRKRGASTFVDPDDARLRGPVTLEPPLLGEDGDAVVVRITRFPEFVRESPVGVVEKVLGRPGELPVEVAKLLAIENVDEPHSHAALLEAAAFGNTVPASMRAGREDLTQIPFVTIDPEDARDHDDAVFVERTHQGGYRVWVAIADVATFVTPNSALDDEAKARGVSVYLPDRALPMLPEALSSKLGSLLADHDRLALCAVIELLASGAHVGTVLKAAVVRICAKLTYGGAAAALGLSARDEDLAVLPHRAHRDMLRVAYELSRILRSRRLRRGALDLDLPEAQVVLDATGVPVDVRRRAEDPGVRRAYQLIEEMMLLANEAVADWLGVHGAPAIFRVHPPPDPQKLERFAAIWELLGGEGTFDVDRASDPKFLSRFVSELAGHPRGSVLQMLLLRALKQASYEVTNTGHFGLASKAYLHFTSPIRRYPDLLVHRIVHEVLAGKRFEGVRLGEVKEGLAEAARLASAAERRAMEVERAVVDLYRAALMRGHLGERFEGTVVSVVGSGVFVSLDSPFVDVMVRLEDLGQEPFEVDMEGLRAVGRRSGDAVALGDRVVVEVMDAILTRRMVVGRRLVEVAHKKERKRVPKRPEKKRPEKKRPAKKTHKKLRGKKGS